MPTVAILRFGVNVLSPFHSDNFVNENSREQSAFVLKIKKGRLRSSI